MKDKLKLAICQMTVTADKEANLEKAGGMIDEAAAQGCGLAVLPEMFNCPYSTSQFRAYAENPGGPSWRFLEEKARTKGIYLIGGSIPELDEEGRVFNTSLIYDPQGTLIGKHRKVHLFDVDIKGGIRFKESETLSPGETLTVVDTAYGPIGVAICFDIRFAEMMRAMAFAGARLIVIPAAFNMTTGPAHWELTFRARGLDNQLYMAGAAPARNESASYVSWAHSLVTDPWGRVAADQGTDEGVLLHELDLAEAGAVREQLPILKNASAFPAPAGG